jgi:hypothetical protein
MKPMYEPREPRISAAPPPGFEANAYREGHPASRSVVYAYWEGRAWEVRPGGVRPGRDAPGQLRLASSSIWKFLGRASCFLW